MHEAPGDPTTLPVTENSAVIPTVDLYYHIHRRFQGNDSDTLWIHIARFT